MRRAERSEFALLTDVLLLMILVAMGYTAEAAESLAGDSASRAYILAHTKPIQAPDGAEEYACLQHLCRVIDARIAAQVALSEALE